MNDLDPPTEYNKLPPKEQETLQYWIAHAVQPATRYDDMTSYGLKHAFEAEAFYVTNGEFKGAMLAAGYEPKNQDHLNWTFKIKPTVRVRRPDHEYAGIRFNQYLLWEYSLRRFDSTFAKLLRSCGHKDKGENDD